MKFSITFLLCFAGTAVFAQDYPSMARTFQQQYKDAEAVILQSSTTIELAPDTKAPVKVSMLKKQKLLSLRYNRSTFETEWYDQNSHIDDFFANSSLKQKAANETRRCGAYTSEGLYYDDSKFCTHELKLKELGEVWDITSLKRIDDARYLTTVYMQEKHPVIEKTITFIIPENIDAEIKEFNLADATVLKTSRQEQNKTIIEYTVKSLAAQNSESLDRGYQYTTPHLLVLVKSVTLNGKKTNVLSSPQDLYNWYSGLTQQLKPNPQSFKSTVTQLTQGKKTDEDKIKAVYYWVQDNIRYIAFEDGLAAFKPSEAQDVYEKRYGDCKGMANLTKEMLKAAGYDARLTWIGTRRILYDQSLPSLAVNNHMICTVLLNDKKYFLDATEKYVPFGENAVRIQSRPVMIEDGMRFIADRVSESAKGHDCDKRNLDATLNGEVLEGTFNVELTGEAKKNFLYNYHYTKSEKRQEFIDNFISGGNKKVNATDFKLPDLEERSGPLQLSCHVSVTGAVSAFNNEYYIDLDPAKALQNMTIEDTRQHDIDFGERVTQKTSIVFTVPPGYTVSYLPEKVSITDHEFSFMLQYTQQGNKIIYTKELTIPDGIIQKKSLTRWNDAIKKLTKGYEDQIVLKK